MQSQSKLNHNHDRLFSQCKPCPLPILHSYICLYIVTDSIQTSSLTGCLMKLQKHLSLIFNRPRSWIQTVSSWLVVVSPCRSCQRKYLLLSIICGIDSKVTLAVSHPAVMSFKPLTDWLCIYHPYVAIPQTLIFVFLICLS